MSDITSTIAPNNIVLSSLSGEQTLNSLTTNIGALSQLTDVDLQGVTNGSLLIYDTNEFVSRNLTGAISVNANGLTSVNSNAITLGTQAIKVFTDSAEAQSFIASKIDGYVPLGVPTGYSVLFADDGSAEIVYTPPVIQETIDESEIDSINTSI